MEPKSLTISYCGKEYTLRFEKKGYFVSDPEAACVVKSVSIVGDTLTIELNIVDACR